jgi:hypothetical protein
VSRSGMWECFIRMNIGNIGLRNKIGLFPFSQPVTGLYFFSSILAVVSQWEEASVGGPTSTSAS